MLTSETVPFSKSGGLADVVGALSGALSSNNEVSIVMPLYGSINASGFTEHGEYEIKMLDRTETVEVLSRKVENVTYLALCHPLYTKRNGIYGDSSFSPYSDNFYRYALMCKTAVKIAEDMHADILHCHDWTAGLACYLAKESRLDCKTVFTIHNLAYMGEFPRYDALSASFRPTGKMLSGTGLTKCFNMLKTGVEYADAITTVSPTYAGEIQTREQGCGIDDLLRSRNSRLYGIINGIDTEEWNPETDAFFKDHFSISDLSGKAKLKERAQIQFGLNVEPEKPLIAMISRLAEQKGFGPLLEGSPCALEQILSSNRCQFIIIGTGDKRYETKLKDIAMKYKNISVNIVFSQALSHLVEAASDFFLMPSKYEPCGLNQMYSLRYGTLPIAHRTGGLNDTIHDISEGKDKADGFLFSNVYSDEIVDTVHRAVEFYYSDKEGMKACMLNGMKEDFSWTKSAQQYEEIYRKTLGGNQL